MMKRIAFTFVGSIALVGAFSTKPGTRTPTKCLAEKDGTHGTDLLSNNRRGFLASSAAALVTVGLPSLSRADEAAGEPAPAKSTDGQGVTMYKTGSGLKYIELEKGSADAVSPRYGQLCIVSYTAYIKLPNAKEKDKFDSTTSYIMKHGNGKMIPGLDEGLHTMKVGGLRRIIIPPKLGFVVSGLGPLPEYPWNRFKLNKLLEDMITQQGGNLVYDVRLEKVLNDEADQGYYEDEELSAEEIETIQKRLTRGATPAPNV